MAYRQRIMVGVTFFTQCKEIKFGKPWDWLGYSERTRWKKPRAKNRAVSAITGREILSTVNIL